NGGTPNLDFETGTLQDWTATGDAFTIVKTDDASGKLRTPGSGEGTYWTSSAVNGNARTGTLTSMPFPVTHPYASFLVAGGAFASTRVEILDASDNTVIFSITGANRAGMRPAVVDLRSYAAKNIIVRLVDDET